MKKIAICYPTFGLFADLVKETIKNMGYEVVEFFDHIKVAKCLLLGNCDLGIVYCGTNLELISKIHRFNNIRCAQLDQKIVIKKAREMVDANVLCVVDKDITEEEFVDILKTYLKTEYISTPENDRFVKMIDQLSKDELIS